MQPEPESKRRNHARRAEPVTANHANTNKEERRALNCGRRREKQKTKENEEDEHLTHSLTTTLAVVLIAAFAVVAGTANAAVIYSDSFNRTDEDLNGDAPDTAPGAETWNAYNWETNGTVLTQISDGDPHHGVATLPFTPDTGKVYTLKATIDVTTDASGRFYGFGFTEDRTTTSVQPAFLIEEQDSRWRAYVNQDVGGNTTTGSGDPGDGAVDYAIELDTNPALWTVNFFVDGSEVASSSFTENPTINYVEIQNWAGNFDGSEVLDSVDNFELSDNVIIPEPASLALLGLGGLLIAGRRRRN